MTNPVERSKINFEHGRKTGLGTTDYDLVTLTKD